MLTLDGLADHYLGHLSDKARTDRTRRSYGRIIDKFVDRFPRGWDANKITEDDCRRFLNQWVDAEPNTRAAVHSPISGMFAWGYRARLIKQNPMENIHPPVRPRPEDLDVTTVAPADVRRLLAFANTWSEKLAVAIPAYTGARRAAAARLRLTDYDQGEQLLRFREKGRKVIWKPVPLELVAMLEAAIRDGAILYPDGYLIPSEAAQRNQGDRDPRIVLNLVKRVARRAGVDAHVHALRAAFACFYLETHEGDLEALQTLMGHASADTTRIYLRKLDRRTSMERVRDLSWGNATDPENPQFAGSMLEALRVTEKEGFEPSLNASPLVDKDSAQPDAAGHS